MGKMGRGYRSSQFIEHCASAVLVAIIAGLSGLVGAAPVGPSSLTRSTVSQSDLAPRYSNDTTTYSNTTLIQPTTPTVNASLPTTTGNGRDSGSSPIATILPLHTSLYHSKTGAVDFNTPAATVSRDHANNGADISTLVTFLIDSAYADRTCEIVLDLSSQRVSGSQRADLYTSSATAWTDTAAWPQGNLRDRPVGRVLASSRGGRAVWEEDYNGGPKFACEDYVGRYLAGEVVPVGDDDFLTWKVGAYWSEGVKIVVW